MKHFVPVLILILFSACNGPIKEGQLFNLMDSERTGITFVNKIEETEKLNYFTYPYLYMGGGTAVGDFNNDGLEDIFLTGNQVSNKLLKFRRSLSIKNIEV